MDDIGLVIKAGVGALGTVSAAFIGLVYKVRKDHAIVIDDHTKKIVALEETIVPEQRVREVIKEELNSKLEPISETLDEIKDLCKQNTANITSISNDLAQQKGYQQALKELKSV